MNFLKLTIIDTPSPRDADASKKFAHLKHLKKIVITILQIIGH